MPKMGLIQTPGRTNIYTNHGMGRLQIPGRTNIHQKWVFFGRQAAQIYTKVWSYSDSRPHTNITKMGPIQISLAAQLFTKDGSDSDSRPHNYIPKMGWVSKPAGPQRRLGMSYTGHSARRRRVDDATGPQ